MYNNFLSRLWHKTFNNRKYQDLKNEKRTLENVKYYKLHIHKEIDEIEKKIKTKKELTFLHSGQLGDLIYSLATIKELSKKHKCDLYIQTNKSMQFDYTNSTKQVLLTDRSCELIIPLLKEQEFLNSVKYYNGESIDVNFDLFRKIPINLSFYSTRWFSHLAGINIDVTDTFLSVKAHIDIKDKIIIHRSPRYRNAYINYKFLNDQKNLLCIGLENEYKNLKKEINNLEFHNCKNFLEMAQIVKGSKFYIGNMSFQYIIAEGLKVPRLLEASPDFPVVFPVGSNSYDAYHQIHFENFFNKLNRL
jgi:hypothetical protein